MCLKLASSDRNRILASCPWTLVTANGVELLTEIYVIYIEGNTRHHVTFGSGNMDCENECIRKPKIKPIGPTAAEGGSVTDGRKAKKYIRIK